jgi:NAD-dependent dihydropyrimidine dehydrogenase PreA subunit
MTYVITASCVDVMDRSCIDECPVDCIQPGTRMMYIDPDVCIDCGACEPVCPQEAIFVDILLPEELRGYASTNASFYQNGAEVDPPEVTALPPRD